jgi:hypothetical protein
MCEGRMFGHSYWTWARIAGLPALRRQPASREIVAAADVGERFVAFIAALDRLALLVRR